MTNREKFNIIYKNFAQPVASMKMTYESSALTVGNRLMVPEVVKKYEELLDALKRQLDSFK